MHTPANNFEQARIMSCSGHSISLPNRLEVLFVHDPASRDAAVTLDVDVGTCDPEHHKSGIPYAVADAIFNKPFSKYNQMSGTRSLKIHHASTQYSMNCTYGALIKCAASAETPMLDWLEHLGRSLARPCFVGKSLHQRSCGQTPDNQDYVARELPQSSPGFEDSNQYYARSDLQITLNSLQKNIAEEMEKFWLNNYSATRMKLVVLASEPVAMLEPTIRRAFGQIPGFDTPLQSFGAPSYDDLEPLMETLVCTNASETTLELHFPRNDQEPSQKESSFEYLRYAIEHNYPGSLSNFLRLRGWISNLSVDAYTPSSGAAKFIISLLLTTTGLNNHGEVIKIVFQYLSLLNRQLPSRDIMDELCRLIKYNPQRRGSHNSIRTTRALAEALQKHCDQRELINSLMAVPVFHSDSIRKALASFRPENFNVLYHGAVLPFKNSDSSQEHFQGYRNPYQVSRIAPDLVQNVQRSFVYGETPSELHLGYRNDLIPKICSRKICSPTSSIQRLSGADEEKISVWWKHDSSVVAAWAKVCLRLIPGSAYPPGRAFVSTIVLCELIEQQMQDLKLIIMTSGFRYHVWSDEGRLCLEIDGPDDTIGICIRKILRQIQDTTICSKHLKKTCGKLLALQGGWNDGQPEDLAVDHLRSFMSMTSPSSEEVRQAAQCLKDKDVDIRKWHLTNHARIEVFAFGNLLEKDVHRIVESIQSTIPPSLVRLQREIWPRGRNGCHKIYRNPATTGNCVAYGLYVGNAEDSKTHAYLRLFEWLLLEPVSAWSQNLRQSDSGSQFECSPFSMVYHDGWAGLRFWVRDNRAANCIEEDIEDLLLLVGTSISELAEEKLDAGKRLLLDSLLNTGGIESCNDFSNIFFNRPVGDQTWIEQDRHKDIARLIQKLDKHDMISFYARHVSRDSYFRAKMSVHIQH